MQDRGWIDLHSHLLPRLDDGSDSVEMSLAMLRREAGQGVTTVCATPHFYANQNTIERFCKCRAAALMRLQAACREEKLPQIVLAAEVHYFPRMEEQPLERLCIEGTKTLFLEMPLADWTDLQVETVMTLVLDFGFRVILVHLVRIEFVWVSLGLGITVCRPIS